MFFLILILSIFAILKRSSCFINDDYCDKGDDEPLTSACSIFTPSALIFQCKDTTYTKQSIYSSRVQDKVCDCCDGSDELNISCPNTCAQIGALLAKERAAKEALRASGLKEREILVAYGNKELQHIRDSEKLEEKIKEFESSVAQYKNDLDVAQGLTKADEIKNMQKFQGDVKKILSSRGAENDERNLLQSLVAAMNLLSGEDAVEAVLKELEGLYELPGKDPDDAEALVLAIDDKNRLKENEIDFQGISLSSSSAESVRAKSNIVEMTKALALDRLTEYGTWKVFFSCLSRSIQKDVLNEAFLYAQVGEGDSMFQQLKDINSALSASNLLESSFSSTSTIQSKISDVEAKLEILRSTVKSAKDILAVSYGPEEELYSFRGRCFTAHDKGYSYEACPFGAAKQNGQIFLGNYVKHTIDKDGYRLHWQGGASCWPSQRPRSLALTLACGLGEPELTEISEPDICTYAGTLRTPIACPFMII